jgi:hypothetical protein
LGRLTDDYDNLYKSHTITKQQYEQKTLAAKQEAESQCVFYSNSKSDCLPEISYVANQSLR